MSKPLKIIVQDYGWIHTSVGLLGNIAFFLGSILFLPQFEEWKVTGVWLFIVGSFLMLVGALGNLLVGLFEKDKGGN